MKKIVVIVLVLVLAVLGYRYLGVGRPVAEVYLADHGTALAAVYGTVKVVPNFQMDVRARLGGIIEIEEFLRGGAVAVSTPVKRGQLMARIRNEDLDREIAKAEAELVAAQSRQQLGPPSRPELETQLAQLQRLETLAASQNAPASELERVRNQVATLRQRVRNETLELDRLATVRQEQADLLRDRRARGEIRAPIDGLVTEIRAVHNEFVFDNSQPFVVATRSNFLEGRINEEDVGLVAPKLKAVVRLYAFAGRDLEAVVAQVLPTGRDQRYTVLLNFIDPPATIRAGMTGEMNIIAGRRENALLIPTRALMNDRLYVVDDGVIAPRQVKIGFRNLEHAEVLEGLAPGAAVVVADHDLFQVGQRVRAVPVNRGVTDG